jgi:serine/threonine-protein kinase
LSPDSLHQQLETSLGAAYTIERELAGGGMSRVFVAFETRFERRMVIREVGD